MGKRIARHKLVLKRLRKPAKPGGNGARDKRGHTLRMELGASSKDRGGC